MAGILFIDHLVRKAHGFWREYETLPLDLHMDMESEGLNVPELERQFYADQHD